MEIKKTGVSHLILDKVEFKPNVLHVTNVSFQCKKPQFTMKLLLMNMNA